MSKTKNINDKLYRIKGFSKKENNLFSQNVSLIDNFLFMIPDTSINCIDFIKLVQSKTPLTYIINEREFKIKDVTFEIKNDYTIVHFNQ